MHMLVATQISLHVIDLDGHTTTVIAMSRHLNVRRWEQLFLISATQILVC